MNVWICLRHVCCVCLSTVSVRCLLDEFDTKRVRCVAAYVLQLETLLTEKIETLTKFRGQFFICYVNSVQLC